MVWVTLESYSTNKHLSINCLHLFVMWAEQVLDTTAGTGKSHHIAKSYCENPFCFLQTVSNNVIKLSDVFGSFILALFHFQSIYEFLSLLNYFSKDTKKKQYLTLLTLNTTSWYTVYNWRVSWTSNWMIRPINLSKLT